MMKLIKWVIGLSLLFGLSTFGNWVVDTFSWKVPGSVIGMVLLLVLLVTKVIRVEWIEDSAGYLTKHLAFFFIPIAVGLMAYGALLKSIGIPLLVTLLISLTVGIVVTALVSGKEGDPS